MKNIAVVNYNTLKRNKKGFTLIELVVVIAVLAVLCTLALPIIAYRLDMTKKNSAATNAHTIEYAIKEAQSAQVSGDTTIYPNANTGQIKVSDVATKKGINDAFAPVIYKNKTYTPAWCGDDDRVYFVNGSLTMDGTTIANKTDLTATSSTNVSSL